MVSRFQKCLDEIILEFTSGDYYREVYEAKKEYIDNLGKIAEDDQDYENQMDIFMGWYLFDRPLTKHELPPVVLYHRKGAAGFSQELEVIFRAFTQNKHSIFELLKQKGNSFVLKDLAGGEKYEVNDEEFRVGFSRGDLFEARLVPDGKGYVFANGFCFHPKDASKFIELQMKKIREDDPAQKTKLLLKLGHMKNKQKRFPHIDTQHIYTLSPKF